MRLLLTTFGVTLFAATALAQTGAAPRFGDYPARVYKGSAARVNVSSTKVARMFRTALREGAKEGVNFAGHYTVVQWGCGAGCVRTAFVDAKTGAVFFPKELAAFGVWFWDNNEEALQFKPDSRLIVLSGFPASEGDKDSPKTGLYYYEWTGRRLRLVKFVEKKREAGS